MERPNAEYLAAYRAKKAEVRRGLFRETIRKHLPIAVGGVAIEVVALSLVSLLTQQPLITELVTVLVVAVLTILALLIWALWDACQIAPAAMHMALDTTLTAETKRKTELEKELEKTSPEKALKSFRAWCDDFCARQRPPAITRAVLDSMVSDVGAVLRSHLQQGVSREKQYELVSATYWSNVNGGNFAGAYDLIVRFVATVRDDSDVLWMRSI